MKRVAKVAAGAVCFLLLAGGCARPAAKEAAPPEAATPSPPPIVSASTPAPAVTPPPTPPPQTPGPAGFTAGTTGGGDPQVSTTVDAITTEAAADGSTQLTVHFGHGVPAWAVHVNNHGNLLWVELAAPRKPGLPDSGDPVGVHWDIGGSATDSWLTLRGGSWYQAEAKGDALVLTLHSGAVPSSSAAPLTGAAQLVDAFMKVRLSGGDPLPYLAASARPEYARLSNFKPLRFKVWRESGEWPATALYLVHLENDQAFTDEMLFVTPEQGKPVISVLLGHQPVPLPQQPDDKAAFAVATQYLDSWSRRDHDGQFQALAPSEQKGMTEEQKMLLGGLSNPHPFRYEIHQWAQVAPGCYRFDLLRSDEYTGEGELGRGIAPLFVTQQEGRYGVLLHGRCGG